MEDQTSQQRAQLTHNLQQSKQQLQDAWQTLQHAVTSHLPSQSSVRPYVRRRIAKQPYQWLLAAFLLGLWRGSRRQRC